MPDPRRPASSAHHERARHASPLPTRWSSAWRRQSRTIDTGHAVNYDQAPLPYFLRWRKSRMKRSTDHILTTHTGSLPRPEDLAEMIWAREEDREAPGFDDRVRSAVSEV